MYPEQGSCVFIRRQRDNVSKKVAHMILAVGKNDAGIPYNWIGIPITSKETVGEKNLVEINHPKLKMKSYAKIIDPHTFKYNAKYMELSIPFSDEDLDRVLSAYINFIITGE